MTILCRIIIVVASVLAWTATSADEIRLRKLAGGGVAVPVTIEDQDLWMLVDTGSSQTLLRRSVAEHFGLQQEHRFMLHTPTGTTPASCAATSIQLGARNFSSPCVGWSHTVDQLLGDRSLDGVLGADLLFRQPFLLDMEKGILRFGVVPIDGGDAVTLERVGGRLAVRAPVRIMDSRASQSMLLVLDSGADRLVLFGQTADRVARGFRHRASRVRLASLTGARLAYQVPHSRLGSLRVDGPVLLPEVTRHAEDGLLPLNSVSPVFFDGSRGLAFLRAQVAVVAEDDEPGMLVAWDPGRALAAR